MAQGTTGEGFAYSMVDLMTSLAVIFVLLLIYFLDQISKREQIEKRETADNREQVMQHLQKELGALDTRIQVKSDDRDPLTLLVIVPEGLLGFQVGQDEIPPHGIDFLKSFAPRLAGVLCAPNLSGKVDSLIIEGHTDSSGPEEFNIPLSTRRATAVMIESREQLKKGIPGLEPCFLDLASASGRGPRGYIPNAQGTEDKEKSRRVELKVRVRSVEQRRRIREQLQVERTAIREER
jgi:outer membrane protein OmpA-like peptidoglycan-associated protein